MENHKLGFVKRYLEGIITHIEQLPESDINKGRLKAYKDSLAYVTATIKSDI